MKPFCSLSIVLILVCFLPAPTNAQELAKIRSEYVDNPIRLYQPADPWHRSILYKLQTGHYGRYYNCDGEEEKRNSPYICWNKSDCPTIPKKNCIDCVNEQICKVKRRINDGSCRSNPCATCVSGKCNCGQAGYATQPQNQEFQVARRQGNIFEPDVARSGEQKTCNCKSCQSKLNSSAAANLARLNHQSKQQERRWYQPKSVAKNSQAVAIGEASTEKAATEKAANLLSRIRNSQSGSKAEVRTAEAIQQPTSQAAVSWFEKIGIKRR